MQESPEFTSFATRIPPGGCLLTGSCSTIELPRNVRTPQIIHIFGIISSTMKIMSRDFWRSFLVITPVAFALHFVWETLHIPLYTNYGDISVLPFALYAAPGDVFYTLLAVACIALYKRDAGWMRRSAGRGLRAHITARFVRRRIGRVQSD